MALPRVGLPTSTVSIDGHSISVRGLTRGENAEVSRLIEAKRIEDAEVFILAAATDTPRDDAAAWYAETPNPVVERVLNEIGSLTRLDEEASKSGPAPVHAGRRDDVGLRPGREAEEVRG